MSEKAEGKAQRAGAEERGRRFSGRVHSHFHTFRCARDRSEFPSLKRFALSINNTRGRPWFWKVAMNTRIYIHSNIDTCLARQLVVNTAGMTLHYVA